MLFYFSYWWLLYIHYVGLFLVLRSEIRGCPAEGWRRSWIRQSIGYLDHGSTFIANVRSISYGHLFLHFANYGRWWIGSSQASWAWRSWGGTSITYDGRLNFPIRLELIEWLSYCTRAICFGSTAARSRSSWCPRGCLREQQVRDLPRQRIRMCILPMWSSMPMWTVRWEI